MGACTAGNNVTWAVVANASNACGNDSKEASASVRCKAAPCVDLTADRNPTSACPGDAVTISGTVRNCSTDPETIVVTVNGEQVFSGVVQPGQTQNYSKSAVMPACTAGQSVPWNVVAIATNDCDQVGQRKEQTVSVQCKNPPCVQLIDVRGEQGGCLSERARHGQWPGEELRHRLGQLHGHGRRRAGLQRFAGAGRRSSRSAAKSTWARARPATA
jgi:hypothetical protein